MSTVLLVVGTLLAVLGFVGVLTWQFGPDEPPFLPPAAPRPDLRRDAIISLGEAVHEGRAGPGAEALIWELHREIGEDPS